MAEANLEKCKNDIKETRFAHIHADSWEKRGIFVDGKLNPSKNWSMMRYYNLSINNDIKKKFKDNLSKKLPEGEPIIELDGKTRFIASGMEWDALLSGYIHLLRTNKTAEAKQSAEKAAKAAAAKAAKAAQKSVKAAKTAKANKGEEAEARKEAVDRKRELDRIQVAEKLVDKLYSTYDGLKLIHSKFPLFGFMTDNDTDGSKMPKSYLWQGEADAIAFYNGKYVIVDFKVVTDVLTYQQSAAQLCEMHLHQCLIYAQLLKLHMGLAYLPPILIVAIDGSTGWRIYPPLFEDYPDECKERLKNFKWSMETFSERPPLRLGYDDTLFQNTNSGLVSPDRKLTEMFHSEATVKNLLDALGYGSLEITGVKQEDPGV